MILFEKVLPKLLYLTNSLAITIITSWKGYGG